MNWNNDSIMERRFFKAGQKILRQGERTNEAFLIQSGHARVWVQRGDVTVELGQIGPGEIFGEMALIAEKPHSATVESIDGVTAVPIDQHVLALKLKGTDPMIRAIVQTLMKRIYNSNDSLLEKEIDKS